ncbi:predicted protein [Histoplasma capsulatum var. duboisii H88]|uniref:Predicted protein n=1 Tax=Ajellomyces capsulatus (strain H88) TaxID=544711 RepID=F0UR32_AJEC8|nr:predicted protein [Histoplasma capsulatum var. duboisii H88]
MVGTVLLLPTEMICQISFETLKSNSQRIRGLGGIRTFGLTSASYPHGQSATTSKSKAGPLFPGMPFVARSSVITITCGHNVCAIRFHGHTLPGSSNRMFRPPIDRSTRPGSPHCQRQRQPRQFLILAGAGQDDLRQSLLDHPDKGAPFCDISTSDAKGRTIFSTRILNLLKSSRLERSLNPNLSRCLWRVRRRRGPNNGKQP